MTDRQRYDQIWKPIAVRSEPPEGEVADELRAWLRDATPEDLWRALRCVYAGSRPAISKDRAPKRFRRSPNRPEEAGAETEARESGS